MVEITTHSPARGPSRAQESEMEDPRSELIEAISEEYEPGTDEWYEAMALAEAAYPELF